MTHHDRKLTDTERVLQRGTKRAHGDQQPRRSNNPQTHPEPHADLHERLSDFWSELETHYAPSLKEDTGIECKLEKLDARILDGDINEQQLKRAIEAIRKPLRRSYDFNHTAGSFGMNPGKHPFWDTPFSGQPFKDKTRFEAFKSTNGMKNTKKQGRGKYVVSIGNSENRIVEVFSNPKKAQVWRDEIIEARKTIAQTSKLMTRNEGHEADKAKELSNAKTASRERKAALKEVMKPHPVTGETPSWSEVLRRPEFILNPEPPKPRPST